MDENRRWTACWIWAEPSGEALTEPVESVLFRRSFRVADPEAARVRVSVSADSRYRLFLNGRPVCAGPCKGDAFTHYYETIELAGDTLQEGVNVLAAQVVHYPNRPIRGKWTGPASVWRSDQGGWLLEGNVEDAEGRVQETLNTGSSWKCRRVPAAGLTLADETFTLFVGGGERADGSFVPRDWASPDAEDAAWRDAVVVSEAYDPMYGGLPRWLLAPRPIPLMREEPAAFVRVVRGSDPGRALEAGQARPITVRPGERLWLEYDAGELVAGHPRLELRGGKGAVVRLLHSECYEYPPGPGGKRNKGVRDDPEGKSLYGLEDEYRVRGDGSEADAEVYEPFHRRAFRFVQLTVEAAEEPLTIVRFDYRRTGYPLDALAEFACSDDSLNPLWKISLNTLRNCMHETYEDTPYYEQMGYEMDSRLQALFTYSVSGDDRLARKIMYDFHGSLMPTGMLQSRYPSVDRQIIPGFALYWIQMVHDHYVYFADERLVRTYLPTMDAILGWFDRKRDETGLVGAMPEAYWSFVDWTEEWRASAGALPAVKRGPLTVYNLMYADALEKAAELNGGLGRNDTAAEYRERAERIRQAARRECWSERRGLFRDGPGAEEYSRHAQIWAVLSGTATGPDARELMERMLEEPDLARTSFAMSYYLFRALEATGLYSRTSALWQPWKEQVGLHLTAWVEDPVSERSDCHAWGALPLYEFTAELLGVKPGAAGYAKALVEPRLLGLRWARGTAATPRGPVRVEWFAEGDEFTLKLDGPDDLPAVVQLPDGSKTELAGLRNVRLSCKIINETRRES